MESAGSALAKEPTTTEQKKSVRIEHMDGMDVVVNLNYPNAKSTEEILALLRTSSPIEARKRIASLEDDKGNEKFFVKEKNGINEVVDFARGRTEKDVINPEYVPNPSQRTRYAFAGIVNEILLSSKVKKIVASDQAQAAARKSGFSGLRFIEPIAAIVFKETKEKCLVYENIVESPIGYIKKWQEYAEELMEDLAADLKKIFLNSGINPTDLRRDQFIITEEDGKFWANLIDIEAYTPS